MKKKISLKQEYKLYVNETKKNQSAVKIKNAKLNKAAKVINSIIPDYFRRNIYPSLNPNFSFLSFKEFKATKRHKQFQKENGYHAATPIQVMARELTEAAISKGNQTPYDTLFARKVIQLHRRIRKMSLKKGA